MKLSNLFLVLFAAFALGFSACSSDDSSSSTTVAATPIDGTWSKGCQVEGSGGTDQYGMGNYYNATLVFADAVVTNKWMAYEDVNCSTPKFTTTATGAYSATDTVANISFTTVSVVVSHGDYETGFNTDQVCGHTDWALGDAKDVTTCADYAESLMDATDITYEISADGTTMTLNSGTANAEDWTKQ